MHRARMIKSAEDSGHLEEEEWVSGAHSLTRESNSILIWSSDLRLYNDPGDMENWYGARWIVSEKQRQHFPLKDCADSSLLFPCV